MRTAVTIALSLLAVVAAATGLPPHAWLIRERVGRARELLESSDLTIERIAAACGFGSAETLRHHFRREMGTPPTRYRAAFGV